MSQVVTLDFERAERNSGVARNERERYGNEGEVMSESAIAERLREALDQLSNEDLELVEAMAVRLARRRASSPKPRPYEEAPPDRLR